MAQQYASYNNVIYEVCNEPCNGATWGDVKFYASEVIPSIRSYDKDAVILIGTPNWSQDVDEAVILLSQAMIISCIHCISMPQPTRRTCKTS